MQLVDQLVTPEGVIFRVTRKTQALHLVEMVSPEGRVKLVLGGRIDGLYLADGLVHVSLASSDPKGSKPADYLVDATTGKRVQR